MSKAVWQREELATDPHRRGDKAEKVQAMFAAIAKAYDLDVAVREGAKDSKGRAIDHGFAERSTFIVTPDSKVVMTIANVAPVANVESALLAVQGLAKK